MMLLEKGGDLPGICDKDWRGSIGGKVLDCRTSIFVLTIGVLPRRWNTQIKGKWLYIWILDPSCRVCYLLIIEQESARADLMIINVSLVIGQTVSARCLVTSTVP